MRLSIYYLTKTMLIGSSYRVNLFGFPNAAGLVSQNLGILDQRAALEWVRDNIEAFGGDRKSRITNNRSMRLTTYAASKITLWGQSAGAASVDFNNFAFYQDPIVTGFFAQSGSALLPITSEDTAQSNFSFVASHLGCNHPNDSAKELECMRRVSWEDIEDFVGGYTDNGTMPSIAFNPIPDDKIIFSDYKKRYEQNKVSQRPAIFSTCREEGNSLVPYHHSGINETAARELTLTSFLCPAVQTSKWRTQAGLTTYRYQYAGDFDNVSPLPWMGPYHASDLPMLFGTHQDYTNGEGRSTAFEFAVSERMEDLVFSFMLDPHRGSEKHGWTPYTSGELLRFGAGGKVMQNVSVESVDDVCSNIN